MATMDDMSDMESDGDQELHLNEEVNNTDFYALLNVGKDATLEEIVKSYKAKCRVFHPDRYTDQENKETAQRVFVQIQRAYEVLSDPTQRAVYDTLGASGLEVSGFELVTRSSNPDNIRREYEFLKRLRNNEVMMQRTHPGSNFLIKANFIGIFEREPEYRYAPYILGMGISQSVDCLMTSSDRVGLIGKVKAGNGLGEGSIVGSWKRSLNDRFHIEGYVSSTPNACSISGKAARAIGNKTAIILQPSLNYQYGAPTPDLQIALALSRSLGSTMQGTITYGWSVLNGSVSLTTQILKNEANLPKYIGSITLSPMNTNVRGVYHKRWASNDAHLETSCSVSFFGAAPAFNYERKLSKYTKISWGLSFTYPTCLLITKFRLRMGMHTYEFQGVLCDDQELAARAGIYGVIIPTFAFILAKNIFRRPFQRLMRLFEDEPEARQVDPMQREEAQNVIRLLRDTADRIIQAEMRVGGLIITEAKYGQMESTRAYPVMGERVIDVTVSLQSMVHDSQLRVVNSKSHIPGFYDPCPGEDKMLHIKYQFNNKMHSVTVPDGMAVKIPQPEHEIF
ncbi:hypothetical protein L596_011859 [Steinernema carpocapsae]|uniref:J domain-containing protein n=1 Tax=Steinernema carpocapsae TaxID=34508 RepID=A0A4U5NVJ9_STECR|nr:hypothetical protein L596_011859 [Steinernema carpocapsae]